MSAITRPGTLLAIAVASYLIVVAAAFATPNVCFTPTWFNVVSWIFLPLGIVSTFAAVFIYGHRQEWNVVGSIIGAAISTVLVGVPAVYGTFAITIDSGCFS